MVPRQEFFMKGTITPGTNFFPGGHVVVRRFASDPSILDHPRRHR
jgi:hypothetical protein